MSSTLAFRLSFRAIRDPSQTARRPGLGQRGRRLVRTRLGDASFPTHCDSPPRGRLRRRRLPHPHDGGRLGPPAPDQTCELDEQRQPAARLTDGSIRDRAAVSPAVARLLLQAWSSSTQPWSRPWSRPAFCFRTGIFAPAPTVSVCARTGGRASLPRRARSQAWPSARAAANAREAKAVVRSAGMPWLHSAIKSCLALACETTA
jgi:hypothetical protein